MKNKILKRSLSVLAVIFILVLGAGYLYVSDYYHALPDSLSLYQSAEVQADKIHVFGDKEAEIGVIFYPGGKVEAAAYAKLMDEIAQSGVAVFLLDMPFNLAVFDADAADDVRIENPQIKTWYLSGHSLGGAMAASHLSKRPDTYAGLILLAAYPLEPLSEPLLILRGSEDQVLNLSKLEGYESIVIQGGNHAYFGSYGEQEGDGVATITADEQRYSTVNAIRSFIGILR